MAGIAHLMVDDGRECCEFMLLQIYKSFLTEDCDLSQEEVPRSVYLARQPVPEASMA